MAEPAKQDKRAPGAELNPRTTHFEFSGPVGTLVLTIGLPLLVNVLCVACTKDGCPPGVGQVLATWRTTPFLTARVFKAYLLWLGALALADRLVPGAHVPGTELRTGERLQYKFNGTNVIVVLAALLAARGVATRWELPELQFVYDNLVQLANASIVTSFLLSAYLYASSFFGRKLLALGGNSHNPVYDFFMGRELNPRIGNLDLKLFLEMRPGLLLWVLIDLAMVHHQYLRYGRVSASILMVTAFQTYYVVEGTFYEQGLVSMIDTTTDGLGFMLVFGDISLVPFTYSLQARYLADHPTTLSWLQIAGITGVYLLGIAIFRLANNEKNNFKRGIATKRLSYIQTPTGSKLLTSGWWGMARHINYTGDWISSWAYSLPCGRALLPYYYVVYFATLLVHRETRDEAKCAAKYGATWTRYKELVPYKFFPYIL